jgi:hypothetical protein
VLVCCFPCGLGLTTGLASCLRASGSLVISAAHLADMSLMADILLIISRSSASLLLF